MQREDVVFDSNGEKCAAWLYRAGGTAPRPCIVMAHGLGAVREMQLDAFAERFAAEGWSALVFDYRHFGGSEGRPRQVLDIGKQIEDWRAAVAFARELEDVDASKIALWGTSLSGGHVMRVGALEQDVAAVVAQVPHADGIVSGFAGGILHGLRLTPHALWDGLRGLLGLAPHYVVSAGHPGDTALMAAPEAMKYVDLVPEQSNFVNKVAARFVLGIPLYSPGRSLKRVKAPTLVQVGLRDETTPARGAIAAAEGLKHVTLKTYDCGHFEPYIALRDVFLNDQVAFLKQQLT